MITNAQRMSCGNCGHNIFRVFHGDRASGGLDGYTGIYIECMSCESITTITPSAPRLELGWGPKAEGILCPMEGHS